MNETHEVKFILLFIPFFETFFVSKIFVGILTERIFYNAIYFRLVISRILKNLEFNNYKNIIERGTFKNLKFLTLILDFA